MILTRRGRLLRDYVVLALLIAVFLSALVWAWESGQNKQCRWYQQHRPEQAQAYCGP